MARSRVRDMTQGNPMKLVVEFTLPLLFGLFFQQLYSFVDTAIVGKFLGTDALASVGSTGSLNFLILGFCMGICSGFGIPIAQAFGAKDESELRRCVANAIYLAAVLSAALAVVTAIWCRPMLVLMRTPEEILDGAVSYIQPIFMAIPVTVMYNLAGGILRSIGDSRTPVVYLVLAALLNIVLDLFFVVNLGMGVMGAAVATVISQFVSGLGCIITMVRRFPILKMSRDDRQFRFSYIRRLFNMGVPMGLQYSITAIGSVVLQTAVNSLGTIAVASVTAANKLSLFFSCIFDALATAMATFAGQNVGAKKLERIHQGLRAAAVIGIAYSVLACGLIALFGKQLIGIFVDADSNPQVIGNAYHFLLITSAFYILLLFVNIVRFSIQGMGFTQLAVFAGVFEMVARILVAWGLVPVYGFDAACFASPVAWVFADAFLLPCYFYVHRRLRQRLFPAGTVVPDEEKGNW